MAGCKAISKRLAGLGLALLLAGCAADDSVPAVAEGGEAIACAVSGAKVLTPVCAVDRMRQNGALMLVVRHPDGAFRRFTVLTDGRGVAAADGADEARTSLSGSMLDVAVASDRYRFPVTVRTNAPRQP